MSRLSVCEYLISNLNYNFNAAFFLQTMSKDQKMLYESSKAIVSGYCPPSLARMKLPGICHSRWLTTAIRINFLFMSMASPSPEVWRLATFVVTIYTCLWFDCKLNWRCTDAPKIIFRAMKLMLALPKKEWLSVKPVFERSFYWGHPEQLLLACLSDADADVRSRAVARIIKARALGGKGKAGKKGKVKGQRASGEAATVRVFQIPPPIYTATEYSEMIDWTSNEISSPPFLRKYSNEDLRRFEVTPLQIGIPNNSQHVERYIQLMAKNATKATTKTMRDGLCKATIQNRQKRPRLEQKSDFS